MTPQDLRIGNWVDTGNGDIEQITGIDQNVLFTKHGCAVFSIVEPIPITEEWLKKFGAEKVNNLEYKLMFNGPEFYFRYNVKWYSSIDMIYLSDRIQYVHQLQNLYHALTGKEL